MTKLAQAFLILSGIFLGGYGLYCVFEPFALNEFATLGLDTPTARTEVRAMYGGLQFSLGLFMLFCGLAAPRVGQGLLFMLFCFAGLAGARALGLAMEESDSGYNVAAVYYEAGSGLIALILLRLQGAGKARQAVS